MGTTKRMAIVGAGLFAVAAVLPAAALTRPSTPAVRVLAISYLAHDGRSRRAYLIVPAWYGPKNHPPIPLVISPHGRGVGARANIRRWGDLPARGRFAVINPEGQGRRLTLFSWGDPGEIRDLARMPSIAERAAPWLQIDRRRVYAFGGSMGGQETLLLVARFPRLLAGAASFDAPTNMAARYRAFDLLPFGDGLQRLARREIGGTPATDPNGYDIRSPLDSARKIAFAGVPLQIWWSTRDRTVSDQKRESGLLYRDIKRLNPSAPVREFVGAWAHTTEMASHGYLPYALSRFGLMPHRSAPPLRRHQGPPGAIFTLASPMDFRHSPVSPASHFRV
jgi:pimeloyl-ACP methyl ester carboxylesterase